RRSILAATNAHAATRRPTVTPPIFATPGASRCLARSTARGAQRSPEARPEPRNLRAGGRVSMARRRASLGVRAERRDGAANERAIVRGESSELERLAKRQLLASRELGVLVRLDRITERAAAMLGIELNTIRTREHKPISARFVAQQHVDPNNHA